MEKQKQPARPIDYAEYERIFAVINTVLEAAGATTANSCTFFAVAGAELLRASHGLNASPVAGAAVYRFNAGHRNVYAKSDELSRSMHPDPQTGRFHCWVHCGDFAIDFMAPLFRESARHAGRVTQIERRMFQKPYSDMAPDGFSCELEGDFWLQADPLLTRKFIAILKQDEQSMSLLQLCKNWYHQMPDRVDKSMRMVSTSGVSKVLVLPTACLVGAW
jgi:hypothetical protein